MALQQFNPTPDVTTHSDARTLFNANFQDAEDRLASLEGSVSELNSNVKETITGVSSSNGILEIDTLLAENFTVTLTEDVTGFVLNGSEAGDVGSLIIRQDDTAGWGVDSTYPQVGGWFPSITGISPSGEGAAIMSWFYDGQDYLTALSDIT
jgi:hypothetical protein